MAFCLCFILSFLLCTFYDPRLHVAIQSAFCFRLFHRLVVQRSGREERKGRGMIDDWNDMLRFLILLIDLGLVFVV